MIGVFMIIYKTTNLINDKIYVGQHYTSADDGYLGSGKILKRAINKYGKDNFKREILEFVEENNINEKEIHWISELSATIKYGNYNLHEGGTGGNLISNHPRKKEIYKKHSERMKGKNNPFYNKKHKPETIKSFYNQKKCIPITIDGVHYTSLRSASRILNRSRKKLLEPYKTKQEIKNKKSKTMKEYFKNEETLKKNRLQKTCKQIKINNIKYQSISDASRILNIERKTISYRLNSKNFPNYKYII